MSLPKIPLTNFLVGYFDCAHFLLCSPFRFVYNKNTGYFSIRMYRSQRAIFLLATVISLLFYVSSIRNHYTVLVTGDNTSPVKYFQGLNGLIMNAFQITYLWKLIFRPNDLLDIVNFIQAEAQFLPGGLLTIQRKVFTLSSCLLVASFSIYRARIFAHPSVWSQTVWNRQLVSNTQYAFFLINSTQQQNIIEPEDLTGLHYFLALLGALATTQKALLGYLPDLCLLFVALTVWSVAYQFSLYIRTDMKTFMSKKNWRHLVIRPDTTTVMGKLKNVIKVPSESRKAPEKANWPDVYRTYQSIRELCQLTNKAIGSLLTVYLPGAMLDQAIGLDRLITVEDIGDELQIVFVIGTIGCLLFISADACDQMEILKTWLSRDENVETVPLRQLEVVMGELRNRDVGVRGSNIFTITYPVIWSVITTVVTYFLICLQSRDGKQEKIEDAGFITSACNCTQGIT